MSDQLISHLEEKISKTKSALKEELNTVRAGRANASLLDKIMVDYYGSPTPLKQMSNVSVPDPRTLMIAPFDPKSISEIERALNTANLGINPSNDGKAIRLVIPQVTEERRKELTKSIKAMGEEAKVAVRNVRRHTNDEIKKEEKAGDLTEDDVKFEMDKVQKLTDDAIKSIDDIITNKEKEVMEV